MTKYEIEIKTHSYLSVCLTIDEAYEYRLLDQNGNMLFQAKPTILPLINKETITDAKGNKICALCKRLSKISILYPNGAKEVLVYEDAKKAPKILSGLTCTEMKLFDKGLGVHYGDTLVGKVHMSSSSYPRFPKAVETINPSWILPCFIYAVSMSTIRYCHDTGGGG